MGDAKNLVHFFLSIITNIECHWLSIVHLTFEWHFSIQVKRLNWTYVHAIAVTGSYGERGMDSFRAAADVEGICIDGSVHKIGRRWTDEDFRHFLLRFFFVHGQNFLFLFQAQYYFVNRKLVHWQLMEIYWLHKISFWS